MLALGSGGVGMDDGSSMHILEVGITDCRDVQCGTYKSKFGGFFNDNLSRLLRLNLSCKIFTLHSAIF